MTRRFKQLCSKCKKQYVVVSWRDKYVICYDCQAPELKGEITDPEFKKMFDIPEEWYKQNFFLRNIKINYLRYGKLSEKQIAAFKKVVDKVREEQEENTQKE